MDTVREGKVMVATADWQREYHRGLFGGLWDRLTDAGLQGLDQLGHFGRAGADLVVGAIARLAPEGRLRLVELGSGLGGVTRHVLDGLGDRVDVEFVVGLDVVVEHCRMARMAGALAVCGSAERPGLAGGRFDVVYASGSVSHFGDMAGTLASAGRLLRPGGLVVFTEEVSLVADGAELGAEFRRCHPEGVFFLATVADRVEQMRAAGFEEILVEDLSSWAVRVLRAQTVAMRVNRPQLAAVYGKRQCDELVATLIAAGAEIGRGAVTPALVTARRAS